MILRFVLGGWQVAERFHQALGVVPRDPFEGRVFHVLESAPGAVLIDDLRLEQADDGFRQRVVIAVAATADRRFDARLREVSVFNNTLN